MHKSIFILWTNVPIYFYSSMNFTIKYLAGNIFLKQYHIREERGQENSWIWRGGLLVLLWLFVYKSSHHMKWVLLVAENTTLQKMERWGENRVGERMREKRREIETYKYIKLCYYSLREVPWKLVTPSNSISSSHQHL